MDKEKLQQIKDYIHENFGFHVTAFSAGHGYLAFIPVNYNFFTLSQVKNLVENFGGYWDYFMDMDKPVYSYRVNLSQWQGINRWYEGVNG